MSLFEGTRKSNECNFDCWEKVAIGGGFITSVWSLFGEGI